jgi:hypothetical protein
MIYREKIIFFEKKAHAISIIIEKIIKYKKGLKCLIILKKL